MPRRVLKPFPWSSNGIDTEFLSVGDVREFGSATSGLEAEELISSEEAKSFEQSPQNKAISGTPENKGVHIPEDFDGLSTRALKLLARQISSEPINRRDEALNAVATEVERRKA